jgi:hypothetical protein
MREPKTHNLKSWPESYRAVLSGRKLFEIRRDDRDFQPGDVVNLLEYDPRPAHEGAGAAARGFTGQKALYFIGYVERSPALPDGWCGFQLVTSEELNRVSLARGDR